MLILDMTNNVIENMIRTQLTNIKLETSRLFIIPLNYDQLLRYSKFDGSLEKELGVLPSKIEFTEELKMTLEKFMIPYIIQYPDHILYATIWAIILKSENVMVGDIGFKGAPSDKGLVEIGYGTYPDFFNKGIMTEALSSITQWAFSQDGIDIILAETDKSNISSQRVLKKNNFLPFAETELMYWWRLDKEQTE